MTCPYCDTKIKKTSHANGGNPAYVTEQHYVFECGYEYHWHCGEETEVKPKLLVKDLENLCYEDCPIYKAEMCGMSSSHPSAYMSDPPCSWLDDDVDVYDWIDRKHEQQRKYDDTEDAKFRAEKERQAKNKIVAEKRRLTRAHVWHESNEIKRLRKRIQANKKAVDFAKSMAEAFNFANSMMGYEERHQPKKEYESKLEAENAELQKRIDKLLAVKAEKIKEYRKKREVTKT